MGHVSNRSKLFRLLKAFCFLSWILHYVALMPQKTESKCGLQKLCVFVCVVEVFDALKSDISQKPNIFCTYFYLSKLKQRH